MVSKIISVTFFFWILRIFQHNGITYVFFEEINFSRQDKRPPICFQAPHVGGHPKPTPPKDTSWLVEAPPNPWMTFPEV